MAAGTVTVTGLKDAERRVERFPETLVSSLSNVASRTADGIAVGAARRLLAQTNAKKTAASITVIDESKTNKQFIVDEPGDPADPRMLPVWLEYGTVHMAAKPHMRPAGDAADDQYQREMRTAAEREVKELVD